MDGASVDPAQQETGSDGREQAGTSGSSDTPTQLKAGLADVYRSIELLVGLSTRNHEQCVPLLTLLVSSAEKVHPTTALAGAALIEHALTRFGGGLPGAAEASTALDEIVDVWACQLLGMASVAMKLAGGASSHQNDRLGGMAIQPLSAALEQRLVSQREWEELAELLVAMTGRASVRPGSPALGGLLSSWGKAGAPSLAALLGQGHLLRVLTDNAKTYEPITEGVVSVDQTSGTTISVDSAAPANATTARTVEQLEAIVAGLAILAWQLPAETGALDMFSNFVQHRTDEVDLLKTYLGKGSQQREQVHALVAAVYVLVRGACAWCVVGVRVCWCEASVRRRRCAPR